MLTFRRVSLTFHVFSYYSVVTEIHKHVTRLYFHSDSGNYNEFNAFFRNTCPTYQNNYFISLSITLHLLKVSILTMLFPFPRSSSASHTAPPTQLGVHASAHTPHSALCLKRLAARPLEAQEADRPRHDGLGRC